MKISLRDPRQYPGGHGISSSSVLDRGKMVELYWFALAASMLHSPLVMVLGRGSFIARSTISIALVLSPTLAIGHVVTKNLAPHPHPPVSALENAPEPYLEFPHPPMLRLWA
ncbi:hypothetical protein DRO64_07945 [Candidatus Bathyarchaeota archaeon]|nr:MAG: hypothetical protein DRO64_07945 [Candidatus Bathyarchaeota archaeon]